MSKLSRTVPLVLSSSSSLTVGGACILRAAGGQPAAGDDGLYAELRVEVSGTPHPRTGYILSISDIDRGVREALPSILSSLDAGAAIDDAWWSTILRRLAESLAAALDRPVDALHLRRTPFHALSLENCMSAPTLSVSRRFDFCAAHRLHLPELSDAENLRLFGPCSHPSGHGHNYRLEVTVAAPAGAALEAWSEIVRREVVERYDHRHLNIDFPEFGAVNPSVENIAQACHDRLAGPLRAAGVTLRRVRVWESEKTSAEVS